MTSNGTEKGHSYLDLTITICPRCGELWGIKTLKFHSLKAHGVGISDPYESKIAKRTQESRGRNFPENMSHLLLLSVSGKERRSSILPDTLTE